MFEAYKVAVKISLINEVSKELGIISTLFGKAGKDVDVLESKLNKLKKIGLVSGMTFGAGFLGLNLVKNSLKPAEDYAHQLNIMNMAGMKQKDIALAVGAAWKTTSTVLTSTATGNLQAFMDLRNIFGDISNGKVNNISGAAISDLPELVRIGAVLKASSNSKISGSADDLAFSIAKALDMRNAVSNTDVFNTQAEMMTKVITALQGRVTPEDYRMLFKYGRQAIPGLSNQFLYEELPTFMMEMKGKSGSGGQGGFGTSLAAFYRFFVQGTMTKGAMQGLQSVGLLGKNVGLRTTTVGTQLKYGEHVKDVDLAASDPFLYTQYDILPAIWKKYGDNLSAEKLNLLIGQIMKGAPQLAIFAVEQYANKLNNVHRDQALIREAQNSTVAYKMALSSDPVTAMSAFNAQWNNFQTAMMMGVIPIVVPALISLTKYLNEFAQWARNNPSVVKHLVIGFTALSGALTILGAAGLVSTAAAIVRISTALTALNAASGASAAGGAAAAAAGGAARIGVFGFLGRLGILGATGYAAYQIGSAANEQFGISKYIANTLYNWANNPPDPYGEANKPGMQHQKHNEVPYLSNSSQPIIIQVDGRTLMQTMIPHMNRSNYLTTIQSSNNLNLGMAPLAPNTGVPYK